MRVHSTFHNCLIGIVLLTSTGLSFGKYSGGTGDLFTPWEIGSEWDLITLAYSPNDWSRHFILKKDIIVGSVWTEPIGEVGAPFRGTFDGKGHTISALRINVAASSPVAGLFGALQESGVVYYKAQVRNLTLVLPEVIGGAGQDVGALVGRIYAPTDVTGTGWVAISGCNVINGNIQASDSINVGGMVGKVLGGTMSRCGMTGGTVQGRRGTVQYDSYAGGLVGWNSGVINECLCLSVASIDGQNCGGLVGYNDATVQRCYAKDLWVMGYQNCGGLVGINSVNGRITDSYVQVQVAPNIANARAGGLIGLHEGYIRFCYAARTTTFPMIGWGAIGLDLPTATYISCFWDATLWPYGGSPVPRPGLIGATTESLKQSTIYTAWGWDFKGEIYNGTDDIWLIVKPGMDYPQLNWEMDYPQLNWEYTALTADLWALAPHSLSYQTRSYNKEVFFYITLPTDVTSTPSWSLVDRSLKLSVLGSQLSQFPLTVDYRWPRRVIRVKLSDCKEILDLATANNAGRVTVRITGQFNDGSGFVADRVVTIGGVVPTAMFIGERIKNDIEAELFRDSPK